MVFSDGKNTFELKHTGAVTLGFLETVYEYIQIYNYELIEEDKGVVDQHWHLLNCTVNGNILVVLTPTGEVLNIFTVSDLKSEIRKIKISLI